MNTWQPSPAAQRTLDKLLLQVIDWGEQMNLHRNMAAVTFDASAPPGGQVQSTGELVFPESVGRAFEEPRKVAEYRQAVHAVTVTALDKRATGTYDEAGEFAVEDLRLDPGLPADYFVNDGLREAYWAANGDRICLRLSPELGADLLAASDPCDRPVARDAALALADTYARTRNEWPDEGVKNLLQAPRNKVFETVVDAKLASQLRQAYTPAAREALGELRGGLARGLRTGFENLAEETHLDRSEVNLRVAELMKPVDETARTVKETFNALSAQQTDRGAATAAADRQAGAPSKHRWTAFGR
ncbi:hypothetical protein [Kribbella sp. NPDC004875]|uniref:hypothetical protein n=1 Tax=Kribbella sp. NPDC004875 TaxID=3364107 RepID=UPI0036D06BC6